MRPLEMIKVSFLRNLHCKLLSCSIFVIILFTLIAKTKDSINFYKLHDRAYNDVNNVLDKYGVSTSGKGMPCDHLEAVDYYYAVFQRLVQEGYLWPTSKSLCIQSTKDQEVIALKKVGISDVAISDPKTAPLLSDQSSHHPFRNDTFDFEFFSHKSDIDVWSVQPLQIASEVFRTLKYGGYLVVHLAVKDEYSFNSFISLLGSCRLLASKEIRGLNSSFSIREAVFRKNYEDYISSNDVERCSTDTVEEYNWDLIRNLEPLEEKEPVEDWTEWRKYSESIQLFKYLPNLVDLSFKRRYIYIDLGARTYDSTIGNWFEKLYPKQNKAFEIYAVEADKVFYEEYKNKKQVTLLPYAAWIRNETLVFGTRNKRREYTGRIQPDQAPIRMQDYEREQNMVQAFDFADWLIRTVSKRDFVVLKMDVEGTEMELIPRLVETGAICLIDELFVECHYDRWVKCCSGKRTTRYNTTYGQCFDLFSKLRMVVLCINGGESRRFQASLPQYMLFDGIEF